MPNAVATLPPTRLRVPRPTAPDPREAFSDEEIAASVAFARPRQAWALVALATNLTLLSWLALTPGGQRLVGTVTGLGGRSTAASAGLVAVFLVTAQALLGL